MNDPITMREFVRRILAMRTDRTFTELQLFEGLKRLAPGLTVHELREAIEWNQARNYVERAPDDDVDEDVFSLTDQGKRKQGLAPAARVKK